VSNPPTSHRMDRACRAVRVDRRSGKQTTVHVETLVAHLDFLGGTHHRLGYSDQLLHFGKAPRRR